MVADTDVASHAAGEIDDDVDLAFADALHDLAVVARRHAEGAGLRIAHVDVDDGGAGAGGLDGRIGDLLRGDRAVGALGNLGIVAGDGARDDDIGVHGGPRQAVPAAGVILWL